MKFFDLEIDGELSNGPRSVSYSGSHSEYTCQIAIYTHGNSFTTCATNAFKIGLFNSKCRKHTQELSSEK